MIRFFEEGNIRLTNKRLIKNWLTSCVESEGKYLQDINFVFCNDDELLDKNIKYLKHNTLTDVITFDYSENDLISGEVYISVDRIQENASLLNVKFSDELNRVMIHGVLHLLGYTDKTKLEKVEMRKKEDDYLALRNF
ncbi:rRNA maturation RNase YbeY [Namhaeicola litoreus]|uniref:Endoribonuclease YbeY n=1 Tax=Namhaeicola litoreus TaxID=1052145 RepID=A0ABW3Y2Q5_9FLAO